VAGNSTTAEAISSMSCSGPLASDGERASDLRQSRFAGDIGQFPQRSGFKAERSARWRSSETPGLHEDVTICCKNRAYYLAKRKLTILDREAPSLKPSTWRREHPDRNFVDACLGRRMREPVQCGWRSPTAKEAAWGAAVGKGLRIEIEIED